MNIKKRLCALSPASNDCVNSNNSAKRRDHEVYYKVKKENALHYNMSMVGGVFGGFAVCMLGEIFGNSQTLNLIAIAGSIFEGDFRTLCLRLLGALLYTAGLALSVVVPRFGKARAEILSLIISAVCMLIISFMPVGTAPIITLYPIFFAMSYQWTQFDRIEGYVSASIFSTNNYRQFVVSSLRYLIYREADMKVKARVFGFTLLWFHLGVALVCLCGAFLDRYSLLVGILPLISAAVIMTLKVRDEEPTTPPCRQALIQTNESRP